MQLDPGTPGPSCKKNSSNWLTRGCRLGFFTCRGIFLLSGLASVPIVLTLELLNSARRIHKLDLPRKERVAARTNLYRDLLFRAPRLERVATAASDCRLDVFWMNLFLHAHLQSVWLRRQLRTQLDERRV